MWNCTEQTIDIPVRHSTKLIKQQRIDMEMTSVAKVAATNSTNNQSVSVSVEYHHELDIVCGSASMPFSSHTNKASHTSHPGAQPKPYNSNLRRIIAGKERLKAVVIKHYDNYAAATNKTEQLRAVRKVIIELSSSSLHCSTKFLMKDPISDDFYPANMREVRRQIWHCLSTLKAQKMRRTRRLTRAGEDNNSKNHSDGTMKTSTKKSHRNTNTNPSRYIKPPPPQLSAVSLVEDSKAVLSKRAVHTFADASSHHDLSGSNTTTTNTTASNRTETRRLTTNKIMPAAMEINRATSSNYVDLVSYVSCANGSGLSGDSSGNTTALVPTIALRRTTAPKYANLGCYVAENTSRSSGRTSSTDQNMVAITIDLTYQHAATPLNYVDLVSSKHKRTESSLNGISREAPPKSSMTVPIGLESTRTSSKMGLDMAQIKPAASTTYFLPHQPPPALAATFPSSLSMPLVQLTSQSLSSNAISNHNGVESISTSKRAVSFINSFQMCHPPAGGLFETTAAPSTTSFENNTSSAAPPAPAGMPQSSFYGNLSPLPPSHDCIALPDPPQRRCGRKTNKVIFPPRLGSYSGVQYSNVFSRYDGTAFLLPHDQPYHGGREQLVPQHLPTTIGGCGPQHMYYHD